MTVGEVKKSKDVNELSKWYTEQRHLYENLARKVAGIIKDVLNQSKIEVYSISSRAKDVDSFIDKASKNKYIDPVKEIKDFAGIRVIAFVRSDVEKCCNVIKPLFDIDESNSVDKGKELGKDKVGYRSVHYVAELKENRLELPEFSNFKGMCFEIQIRTILEHAWADVSHDRSYKFTGKLPVDNDIDRRFSLAAATLELVDREFDTIAKEIDNYQNNVISEASQGNLEAEINSTSLIAYMKIKFKDMMEQGMIEQGKMKESYMKGTKDIIKELTAFGINTLGDLEQVIGDNIDKFEYDSNQTFLSILRDAMILYDADKYFSESWMSGWALDQDSYNFYKAQGLDIDGIMKKYNVLAVNL